MLKSIDTKLTTVFVVAVFAALMTFGPATSSYQSAFAHYGVDSDQCKDDEDYYEDNEEACDKNLRVHYGEDYDGDFGSKSINDDDDNDNNDDDGNSSNQGIGQSQSSRQNSQCVSGGDTNDSCNNISLQNQENSGNNAAAQNGGDDDDDDDDDGNSSNQGIGQNQDNEQNAQCVSGEDAIVSCDNVSFQNQVNSGNNALAQD
ncbi:MAG TPA: hypothetical protein VFT71_03050 [Candidatus Nitrosocosmicus sp.]|nr:hypothetical protein [Candidatus Nitrosocosmicus sp.]